MTHFNTPKIETISQLLWQTLQESTQITVGLCHFSEGPGEMKLWWKQCSASQAPHGAALSLEKT
ncbi:Hypothetical protein SMAX5B_011537 [Scophthalmus maximus]|uniref:Uncharacterized protein n=1 Tax=Scophthalmus maximus TaxID=52904 RepID=A0A2U9BMF0_SCOMX|nr:Hypothetical protein SMAX5B_011537 [Scophthalmus maximus]